MISQTSKVPRHPENFWANIKYRDGIISASNDDREFQQELWTASAQDILFWVNTFVWTYDPRKKPSVVPMITYEFQDSTLTQMIERMGKEDMLIEKSRDMGASWLSLIAFTHQWLFVPMCSFLLGSRKEEYVDKSGDLKGLFQKIDFILEYLPVWMIPSNNRNKLHLKNNYNGSTIDGESTNSDFGRGDRRTAVFLDEFASVENGFEVESATRDVTNCRIYNSTPKGTGNAFYHKREKMIRDAPDKLVRMHWADHPEKAQGLYKFNEKADTLVILDEDYDFPEDYKFIKDGKLRSVWYDEQCRRAASPHEIAQEIDIDYMGSGWQFFSPEILDDIIVSMGRPPVWQGDVFFDPSFTEIKLVPNEEGPLQLWREPDIDYKFPGYPTLNCGADIATGKGGEMSSNSVLSGFDELNCDKVFEYKNNQVSPEKFAEITFALTKLWAVPDKTKFSIVCHEANGPGGQFGKHLLNLGHSNMYRRRNEMGEEDKESKTLLGWWSNKDAKKMLLGQYAAALMEGFIQNYSVFSLKECGQYVHEPDGSIVHSMAKNKVDPTASGENHGDCVIADALAVHLLKTFENRNVSITPEESEEVPYGSKSYRDKQFRKQAKDSVWQDL